MPRTLDELLNQQEPAWPQVKAWVHGAKARTVEVLDASPSRAKDVLLALQVATRSPMGAIAFQTGGLLIDSGWVRLFGGGCSRFEGDLARWNGLGPRPLTDSFGGAMLVGHDVVGGFFALDGGALGEGTGHAFYLAPDTRSWERLTDGDLTGFYSDFRWEGCAASTSTRRSSPSSSRAFPAPARTFR